jgi:HTH-type transcriptional regulator/antitoxin HigA
LVEPGAIAAWLRLGELKAQLVECSPFDASQLRAAIVQMRSLTVATPDVYGPALKQLCAECGVALVFVKEVTGSRVSGATRWLTPTKAIVQLSGRYGTDDHLWFTLFHELAHVLLHGKRSVWIDDDATAGQDEPQEHEADRFAQDILIPPEHRSRYDTLPPRLADIREFARDIGLAPGIVVGRLQREGRLARTTGNHLKRRVEVSDV